MNIRLITLQVQSRAEHELIDLTERVEQLVAASGVRNGLVFVMTKHTTSGIVVNEDQSCLEQDVVRFLAQLAPVHHGAEGYYHNRYLDSDGRLGVNAGAHLQSLLSGYFAYFPIAEGKVVRGSRQHVYFAEYDGPLMREVTVQIIGDDQTA